MVKEKKLVYTSTITTSTKENNTYNTNNGVDDKSNVHPLAAYLKPMEYVEPRRHEFESLEELETIEEEEEEEEEQHEEYEDFDERINTPGSHDPSSGDNEEEGEGTVGQEEDMDHHPQQQQEELTTDREIDDFEEISSPSLTLNEEDLMLEKVTLVEGDQETTLSDIHNLEEETDEFHRELLEKGLILETDDDIVAGKDLEVAVVEDDRGRARDYIGSAYRRTRNEDEFERKLRENHLIMEQEEEEEVSLDQIDKLSDFEIGSTLMLSSIVEESEVKEDSHLHRETKSHLEEAEFVLSSVRQRMARLHQRHAMRDIDRSQEVVIEKPVKNNITITSGQEVSENSWNFMEPKIPITRNSVPEEVIHIVINSVNELSFRTYEFPLN